MVGRALAVHGGERGPVEGVPDGPAHPRVAEQRPARVEGDPVEPGLRAGHVTRPARASGPARRAVGAIERSAGHERPGRVEAEDVAVDVVRAAALHARDGVGGRDVPRVDDALDPARPAAGVVRVLLHDGLPVTRWRRRSRAPPWRWAWPRRPLRTAAVPTGTGQKVDVLSRAARSPAGRVSRIVSVSPRAVTPRIWGARPAAYAVAPSTSARIGP